MEHQEQNDTEIKLLDLNSFMCCILPQPKLILEPWLAPQNLVMFYADRGLGKTFFAMSLALAMTSGTGFLGWSVSNPQGVVYVDGEMSLPLLQNRFNHLMQDGVTLLETFAIANNEYLRDYLGVLNLSKEENRETLINNIPVECKVIILDNISCLFGALDENDSLAWNPIQDWLIRLRTLGYTVIMLHHTNKAGKLPRGASKHEDCLDNVIWLSSKKLFDSGGAQFVISFTKNRAFTSDTVPSIAASLCPKTGKWVYKPVDEAENQELIALIKAGYNQVAISKELGVNQGTVSRQINMLKDRGLI